MAAAQEIDAYLAAIGGESRHLADGEWGLTVAADAAGGWPLDVGMRLADGLLRIQAYVLPADESLDPWGFLFVNRRTRIVRYGCTGSGDIWVHADLPASSVGQRMLDRVLGLVVEAAVVARDYASSKREGAGGGPGEAGWLGGAGAGAD